jgi:hypothetical protein
MERIGLFESIFSEMSARERQLFDQAAEGISALQTSSVGTAEQVNKLFRLDVQQGAEIERLRLTVQVLVDVLVDTLGLDPKVLEYRLEAAFEEAAARRAETEAAGKMITCAFCDASVPATRTNITESGTLCDDCFARRGA